MYVETAFHVISCALVGMFIGDTSCTSHYSCLNNNHVALTYDDGPSDETYKILGHLKEAAVRATFFVKGDLSVGYNLTKASKKAEMIRRIYQEDHVIGSHTWSHPHLPNLGYDRIKEELVHLDDWIYSIIGVRPIFVRPPYGEMSSEARNVFSDKGFETVFWNFDLRDWDHNDATTTLNMFRERVREGWFSSQRSSLIPLQHDSYSSTCNIQDQVVQILKEAKYKIVPLTECLGVKFAYRVDY